MNEAIYVLERGERDDFYHQIISDPNKGPSNISFVAMKDSAVINTYFYI